YSGKIEIDILPKQTLQETTKMLTNRKNLGYKNFGEFMQGLFNTEVNKFVLWQSGIEESEQVTQDKIETLAKTIKCLTFDVVDNYGNNQVKSGGISLDDLTQNLEHKNLHGVYFVGEICDVDGICGGYNLQWAFASGKIAGESI
ncbi:MAG: NAD(P)/FAD-dependent oxidoreductase, partial [Clostridia bacterium]|nr:NAD(P)/FAD-dependent oxidoreductase [Clostridia bacterium]